MLDRMHPKTRDLRTRRLTSTNPAKRRPIDMSPRATTMPHSRLAEIVAILQISHSSNAVILTTQAAEAAAKPHQAPTSSNACRSHYDRPCAPSASSGFAFPDVSYCTELLLSGSAGRIGWLRMGVT